MLSAYRLTAIYAVAGALWIFVTDYFAFSLADSLPLTPQQAQNAKGYLFVALSSGLVFVLMRRLVSSSREAVDTAFAIIEKLPLGIAVHETRTGKVLHANRNFSEIHGWPQDYLNDVDKYFSHVFPDPNYRRELTVRILRDMESEDDSRMRWPELKVTTATGEVRVIDTYGLLVPGRGFVITAVRDITEQKTLEQRVRQLSMAVEQSPVSIMITDLKGQIDYVNPWFEKSTGYSMAEVLGRNPNLLRSGHTGSDEYGRLWQTISSGGIWTGEFRNRRKDGTEFWEKASIGPILDEHGKAVAYMAVKEDVTELKAALETLEQKVMERTESLQQAARQLENALGDKLDSLTYAQRIQQAMLPSMNTLKPILAECFVIYEPCDIVSGDFYWCHATDDRVCIAMGDCTGHGVPGALLSMLGMELLDQIVIKEGVIDPAQVLLQLDESIHHLFSRNQAVRMLNDGMDIGFVCLERHTGLLHYTLAQSFGAIADAAGLRALQTMKHGMGGQQPMEEKLLQTSTVDVTDGARLYLFTDGMQDQFGGAQGKKLTRKRLLADIQGMQHLSMKEQEALLRSSFQQWKGQEHQVDDVTLMAIELPALPAAPRA